MQLPLEQRSFEPLSDALPETGVLDELSTTQRRSESDDALARFLRTTADRAHRPRLSCSRRELLRADESHAHLRRGLAEALVAALNPQLATMARSQLASKIEAETVRWIGERFGWQPPFDGTFTSGGNEANFSGLALALASHFPSSIEDGVASIGAQPVVYASDEAHHSLDKSVGLLGLGRKALRRIPVTDRIQLDVDALQQGNSR